MLREINLDTYSGNKYCFAGRNIGAKKKAEENIETPFIDEFNNALMSTVALKFNSKSDAVAVDAYCRSKDNSHFVADRPMVVKHFNSVTREVDEASTLNIVTSPSLVDMLLNKMDDSNIDYQVKGIHTGPVRDSSLYKKLYAQRAYAQH